MLLKIIGMMFVGLGALGAVLPILPTTPFLLVAAACFAKSSPKMYQRLIKNPVFGPLIKDWQENRCISKKSKTIALLTIAVSISFSCYMLDNNMMRVFLMCLVIFPAIFLYRLPTTESIR